MSKKIAVDARMYGLEHAGIGRYVKNLLHNLPEELTESITLIINEDQEEKLKQQFAGCFSYLVVDARHYSFKEQLVLPWRLTNKFDLVHFPHFNVPIFYQGDFLVSIHDLIKHKSTGKETTTRNRLFYWLKYLLYRFNFWLTVKRAQAIIAPSRWVKKELCNFYPFLREEKVFVVYLGVEEKFAKKVSKKEQTEVLNNLGIKKPFLIYVGSVYPHKNVPQLIKAVKKYNHQKSEHLNLVIACARDVFLQRIEEKVEQLSAQDFVFLPGFVDDQQLRVLYSSAEAFVSASQMEGFGLPGLEAMQVSCPVLVSKSSCFPEVYGQAAVYFDPQDVADIYAQINKLLKDDQFGKDLVAKGRERAKQFSWEETARKTVEVYESGRSKV